MSLLSRPGNQPNGEVVVGDVEHDGRVVLYIIKGKGLSSNGILLKVW